MTQLVYDTSFTGLLTAIFEVYERHCTEARIVRSDRLEAMVFFENLEVQTDKEKAERVWKGLKTKLSADSIRNIYWSFLSELPGIENTILEFARYVFGSPENIEDNFGNASVLTLAQTARKVGREKHRFEAFVRFEKIAQGRFYSAIEPDFNVLPLIIPHFKRRYPAQDWIIYDKKRNYGVSYEQASEVVSEVVINFSEKPADSLTLYDPEEERARDLWRNYFDSVNIAARKNTRLHLRHIPKRYWKYLVEKQVRKDNFS
jgi:probable DNA metabolism protein